VASGSTLVSLSDGHALSFFNCNGTDYIGLDAIRIVFKVVSCPSDTLVTIDVAAPVNVTASGYRKGVRMATHCAPSLASYCADLSGGVPPDPAVGDRNIIGDVKAGFGYLFSVTGDMKYVDWGDDFMGADYGGPAQGPGFPNTPCPGAGCSGPGGDGAVGALITALPPCNTSAPPCGGFGTQIGQGKYYGMADGAGDTPNYLAYRTASLHARLAHIDVKVQAQMNATQVRVAVDQLSGISSQVCSTTPCGVAFDGGQVIPNVRLEYLDADGHVIASSVPSLKVQ
jgi:hypothetical protein